MRLIYPTLLALLSGCIETGVQKQYPDITVSPQTLDFGDVVVDYDSVLPISIQNTGRAPLTVSDVRFDGSRSGAFTIADLGEDGLEIEAGDVAEVDITFAPPTYLPYTDNILVLSDAPEEEEVTVRLFGEGVDGPVPDIAVDTMVVEFDEVYVNTQDVQILQITNEGEGDLVIDQATISGSDLFELESPLTGQTITGGSSMSVLLGYTPDDEEGEHATLTLTSNDPDESPLEITLLGNGGGDFAYPVADFPCPTDVATLDRLNFDGGDSYDPNGNEPLDFYWSLVQKPEGSDAELEQDGDQAEMVVDLAGFYTVELIVENTVGIYSETASCTFEAIPTDRIHVELIWNTNESDLDLHMVKSGYKLFDPDDPGNGYEDGGDVCYCNQLPLWGDLSDYTDDPTLDLDDRWGMGPENINIEDPAEDEYTVWVHYFSNNGGGTTTATVRVYLEGELVDEQYGLMDGEDLWEVGTIYWPDGGWVYADKTVDDTDRSSVYSYWADDDRDGYGDVNTPRTSCEIDPDTLTSVTNAEDCDDTDEEINPDADEVCDNDEDDDCDGSTDESSCTD